MPLIFHKYSVRLLLFKIRIDNNKYCFMKEHSPSMVVEKLAEDTAEQSRRDPIYRAAFIEAVKEGLADFERGDYISFEEHQKEFYSWCTE